MKLQEILNIKKISKLESDIYEVLSCGKRLTVKEIAEVLKRPVESINRSVNQLIDKKLLCSFGKYPKKVKAIPVEIGMDNYFSDLFSRIYEASAFHESLFRDFSIKFIPNRKTYHRLGMKCFKEVKKDVMSIASGTGNLFPDFFNIIINKVKSNVRYRILSLNLRESNKELLENWKRNGIEVRYKKGKNINLVIYDREILQLGLRFSKDSSEKFGFIIKNRTLASFMSDFYEFLWKNSQEVLK